MEDDVPPFRRNKSVEIRYKALDEDVQVQGSYKDELLQKVEVADYTACESLLKQDPTKAATVYDEETQVTPLHLAAKNGKTDILILLLNNKADCNAKDAIGQTPLHLAAIKDHYESFHILLQCPGIQVNMHNKAQDTPLHHAAKFGSDKICATILAHPDADVNVLNKKNMSPLHLAAQENHVKVIKLLIEKGAKWNKPDKNFYLPLHYAAQKGHTEACEVLMNKLDSTSKEKILNMRLRDGKTPMMLAAKEGHYKCCLKLTNFNINARDKKKFTALHYASTGGFENTVGELLEMGAEPNTQNFVGNSPVSEASLNKKSINCLQLLVKKGAKLNVINNKSKTVLHLAAGRNAHNCLKYLLSIDGMKDHLDQRDNEGCTPLHSAIKREGIDCALILLDHGASPTDCCDGDMTPLHLAAGKGYTGICEKLLGMPTVQVSQENSTKATPLHLAALSGSKDVCQMLVRKLARVTAIDNKYRTPLHIAALKGHVNVIKYLSTHGVPLRARDSSQSTALHLAASGGYLECCQVLETRAQVPSSEVDQNRKLPLDRAFDNKHDQVFKFLLQKLPYKDTNVDQMLRLHTYMHSALDDNRIDAVEAIIDSDWWQSGFRGEKGHRCFNYRYLIEHHPSLAYKVQDKCIEQSPCGAYTTYDFRFFDDNYYVPTATGKLSRSPYKEGGMGVVNSAVKFTKDMRQWKQQHPVKLMVNHYCQHLLHHPLTNAWLLCKWRAYVAYIFLALLLVEVFSVVSLTIYMSFVNNWGYIHMMTNTSDKTLCSLINFYQTSASYFGNETQEVPPNITVSPNTTRCIKDLWDETGNRIWAWVILLISTSIMVMLEIFYIYSLRRAYVDHFVMMVGTVLTILVIIPTCPCNYNYHLLDEWQWLCGIVALLVTWLHLITTLNQLPVLFIFMPITKTFLLSYSKIIFHISMLVFSFAFIFHLLLRDSNAFHSVHQSMIKTIVWMLGDLDYESTFVNPKKHVVYPITGNIVFVMFVMIIGGFIANLAIMQPWKRIDAFHKCARYHRAASRCMLFLRLDVCFPHFQTDLGVVKEDNSMSYGSNFFEKLLLLDDINEDKEPEILLRKVDEEQNQQIAALIKLQEEQNKQIAMLLKKEEQNQQSAAILKLKEDIS